jgi:ribosomal protein S18 acetylase RimI-like enzyme
LVLPNLVLPPAPSINGISLRMAAPDDDVGILNAVAIVGFSSPGTATGPEGSAELASVLSQRKSDADGFVRERLRQGLTVTYAAYVDGAPVCVGSHQPVDGVSEVVGVATLPAFRRRGIAAAVVHRLLVDALERGITTVFISADDDNVARIYERVGFRRTATACVAEANEG